jgi:hypothetical protein
MSKKFKGLNSQWFVLCNEGLHIVNNGGSLVLADGYTDSMGVLGRPGEYVRYVTTKTKDGKEIGKRFRFDLSFRRLMTRENDRDVTGLSQFAWLKNYPQCEGSPYGEYVENDDGTRTQVGVWFRELNDARDAEVALQADESRINAQATALGLDEETLEEVGAILGHFGDPDKLMRLRVVEYAGKKPRHFEEILKAGDRGIRATVKKALADGVFKQKGTMIYWNSTVVGADEESAVATLVKDNEMLNAVREALGLKIIVPETKKSRGNPNFRKQKSDLSL